MPSKPTIRAYLALSLDGFIADHKGGVKWLDKYNDPSLGFEKFYRSIDTIIVGRTTFDQSRSWEVWEDGKKRVIVWTSRELRNAPPRVETFDGDARKLVRMLTRDKARQVWHMGGAESLRPFRDAGLVDRWELFVIPEMLGSGVPLFPAAKPRSESLRLVRCTKHKRGIVELQYRRA